MFCIAAVREYWGWLVLLGLIVSAWVLLIAWDPARGPDPEHPCTGYVRIDPIYRPNVDGVMVREERFRCAEWK